MRFYNYVNEGKSFYDGQKAAPEVKKLLSKCKPFIKDYKKTGFTNGDMWLFSGRKYDGDITVKSVRKDRNPKDTPKIVHDLVDDYFEDKFGYRPRSESVFTTGLKNEASRYGMVYLIFPIGKYKILWSSMVEDLYQKLENNISLYLASAGQITTTEKQIVYQILGTYKQGDLKGAIIEWREVMLHCDKYIMISVELERTLRDWFGENFDEKIVNKYNGSYLHYLIYEEL